MAKTCSRILSNVAGMALLLVIGCASTEPSRFYTLSPLRAQGQSEAGTITERPTYLFVGPLFLPDYLDRPQLVSRTGSNEIQIAEFHRWAGSFRADVTRVLVEDLSLLLSSEPVTVLPWKALTTAASAPDSAPHCKIVVEITRFEGTLGDRVKLDATWGLTGREWKDLFPRKKCEYVEPVNGKDYAALVDGMSRALGRLSHDIADAVRPHLPMAQRKE